MYRIIDSRGTGKTSRLFLLAKETDSAVACSNPYAMREKAASYGINGITFITYKEAMEALGLTLNDVVNGTFCTICYKI
mgnify:CR=1 FL=1